MLEMSPGADQPTASASTSDPASSLRAAALLTLKSKRRRPTNDQSTAQVIPPRPPPLDVGFQLDYGQEDTASSPQDGPTKTLSGPAPTSSTSPAATPAEDVQMREEGEISDEENPSLSVERASPDGTRLRSPPRPTTSAPHGRRSTPPKSTGPDLEARTKLSDRIADPTFPTVSYGQGITSNSMAIDIPEAPDSPLYLLDADHVRPGLAITQAQYDTAKDIVLDLLGWGVESEYLVDCGLTREIVYYVFSELNLRLPQNLDITGIMPYTPDMSILMEQRQPSVSMPPPTTAARGRRHSQGNQSLPSKSHGHATQDASAIPPTRTELKPAPAETSPSPTTSSLHDMEQQRRQELLARKAAIASRKSKQLVASSDPSVSSFPSSASDPLIPSTPKQDVEMTVISETVDDFLKSIGPATEEDNTPTGAEKQSQRHSADMDVDEIPGLKGVPSNQPILPTPVPAGGDAKPPHVAHSVASNASESDAYPPSSSDSTNTAFTQTSNDTISVASESQSLQRRGTKRPVAADFDQDLGPRLQNNGSGYLNGITHSNSFGKHRPSGLASVSGMRRCVIDLSDSEGEGDEDVRMRDIGIRDRLGRRSGYSSPAPVVPFTGGWVTPPVSAITLGLAAASTTAGASMSPAVLAEKETEIRKMKEMIAQRERDRQKKLAALRSISSIDTTGYEAPTVSITSVKQEELDVGFPLSTPGQLPNGQTSITPPGSAVPDDHATTGLTLLADVVSAIPTFPRRTTTSSNGVVIHTDIAQTTQSQVLTPEVQQEQVQVNSSLSQTDIIGQQQPGFTMNGTVDVDQATSSSTQVLQETLPAHPRPDVNQDLSVAIPTVSTQQQHHESFTTYNSPFHLYPLLGSGSRSIRDCSSSSLQTSSTLSSMTCSFNSPTSSTFSSFDCPSSSSSSLLASTYSAFSFPNLKPLTLATVSNMLDPSKPVCRYEIPGGGMCRDAGCEDIHLNLITGYGGSGGVEPSDQDTAEYLANTLPVDWLAEHTVSPSKISSMLRQVHDKNPQMVFEERVKEALIMLGAPPPPTPP